MTKNIYWRIISYARPFGRQLPQYLIFTVFGVVFGVVNVALLKPVFEVIFDQIDPEKLQALTQQPEFSFSPSYFRNLFYYYLTNYIEVNGKMGALYFVCVVIVVSVFLANLFRYLAAVVLAKVRANVIRNLRTDIYDKISRMHMGYFSEQRKGDIMSRVTNDVQQVENDVVDSVTVLFKEPLTILVYFGLLFSYSVKLTLFTVIVLPVSGAIIASITKRLRRTAMDNQKSLGHMLNILDESLLGMRVIKAFNARNYMRGLFGAEADNYARLNVSMFRKRELASPISEFFGVLVVAGIILFGGALVLQQNSQLEASTFITYIFVFALVLQPIKALSKAASRLQRGLASGERIFSSIDREPAIQDKPNAKLLNDFTDSIEFRGVNFKYENSEALVLKGINLKVKKGTTVALVGPSGGGKSTLADLIPRFYDPLEGGVYIDGQDLKDVKIESIRQQMGIVTQESILFNDTIFNNIAFGKKNASEEEVIRAAKIANAHDFIMQTENGYQTVIGERGSRLSGGQRQRLSIARAVFKNPPVMILDEATSALDSESEKLVQHALNRLMENRTSVVIAHRLSTIQHADEIIVIQNGEIVERGTHETLTAQQGMYKKLSEMQAFK